MRKRNKKITARLLVFCALLSILTTEAVVVHADSDGIEALKSMGNASEKKLLEEQKKYRLQDALQEDAKDAYDELLDVVDDSATVEKKYAGAYINEKNELVVNLTTSSEKVRDIVQENTESQEVKFKTQKYTYDELLCVYQKIQEAIENTEYASVVSCFLCG